MGKSSVTGIDIGHYSIKVAVLKPADEYPLLVGCNEILVSDDIFTDNHTLDYQKIVKKLKEVKKSLPRFYRKAAVSVPDHTVISKIIQIDSHLHYAEESFAVRQTFSQHSPVPVEELSLDFVPIPVEEAQSGLRKTYQIYATRREIAQQRIEAVTEAGFTPVLLDVQHHGLLSLWNCYRQSHPGGSPVLLDMGYSQSTLCFRQAGRPAVAQNLPWGTRMITKEISVDEAGCQLAGLIQRQLKSWHALYGSEPASSLLVCGGGACLPELIRVMEQHLRMACIRLNPFSLIENSGRMKTSGRECSSEFAMVMGLTMRGIQWLEHADATPY